MIYFKATTLLPGGEVDFDNIDVMAEFKQLKEDLLAEVSKRGEELEDYWVRMTVELIPKGE